jgi:hypothetical protein
MKINVVKDSAGKVVASYEVATQGASTLAPVLKAGEKTEELEVAENYRENLHLIYK